METPTTLEESSTPLPTESPPLFAQMVDHTVGVLMILMHIFLPLLVIDTISTIQKIFDETGMALPAFTKLAIKGSPIAYILIFVCSLVYFGNKALQKETLEDRLVAKAKPLFFIALFLLVLVLVLGMPVMTLMTKL